MEQRTRAAGEEGLDLLTWTMVYRSQLMADLFFDLKRFPFLQGIYECRAREIVLKKAAQMGASEYAISDLLHGADVRKATGMMVFPTDGDVSEFSAARVRPGIASSPYLQRIVGGKDGKGVNRVKVMLVRDRPIYFRGGKVRAGSGQRNQAQQLKSVPVDKLTFDELDEMDQRAPAIALKRLGASSIREVRWISTPTYPGYGIDARWAESDQREWHVKCWRCNEWQPLRRGQVIFEEDSLGRPVDWNGREELTAWVACQKCNNPLNRLGEGRWVARWPEREVAGFHLTKLFSWTTDVMDLVDGLQTTDETARRECINQDWGETYRPRGGKLSEVELDKCRRVYGHGPVEGERTTMGVDVGRVLHVVVRGPEQPESGERPQRWAGEVESWEELGRVWERFGVGMCVIDALPETTKAREFQAERWGRVFLAYYVGQRIGTKQADPVQWNEDEGVVNLDRTRTLDATFGGVYAGRRTLPADARDIPEYYAHLQEMTRVVETGTDGRRVARYVGAGADHLAHAENYENVAAGLDTEVLVGLI